MEDEKQIVSIPHVKKALTNFNHTTIIDLYCDTPGADIYFTLDGSNPNENSTKYKEAFDIHQSTILKAVAIKDNYQSSYVFEKKFVKSKPILSQDFKPGLIYHLYHGIYRSVYDWNNDIIMQTGICSDFNNEHRLRDEWYGIHFEGYIKIPSDDKYTFTVNANDGGQMLINNEEIFESDGRKSHSLLQTYTLELKKGYHKIEFKYYQCSDKNELSVYWESTSIKKNLIPSQNLYHL